MHDDMNNKILCTLSLIPLSLVLSACTKTIIPAPLATQIFGEQANSSVPTTLDNTIHADLKLDSKITKELAQLNNEVIVSNLLYVTHQAMTIENEQYVLLNFHTTNNQVYRTRVVQEKMNATTLKRLQQLKGATLIGVMPAQGYSNQYFFRNFKDLKF